MRNRRRSGQHRHSHGHSVPKRINLITPASKRRLPTCSRPVTYTLKETRWGSHSLTPPRSGAWWCCMWWHSMAAWQARAHTLLATRFNIICLFIIHRYIYLLYLKYSLPTYHTHTPIQNLNFTISVWWEINNAINNANNSTYDWIMYCHYCYLHLLIT